MTDGEDSDGDGLGEGCRLLGLDNDCMLDERPEDGDGVGGGSESSLALL